jgi:cytochrome c-type biogenesis protein CcsB
MFDTILIQDNGGRIEPLNTLASEILRKVNRSEKFMGQTPNQVILGMMVYPGKWQEVPFIRVNHPLIQEELGISGKYASFLDFFASDMYGGYTLQGFVEQAYRKKPAYRNKFDNEIIRVDERLNICYLVYTNALFKFFPDPADEKNTWHSPLTAPEVFTGEDSVFTRQVLAFYSGEVVKSMISDDWTLPDKLAGAIYTFQTKYGEPVLPDNARIRAEAFYNAANIFERIIPVYFLVGFILLMVQFLHIFFPGFSIKWFSITGLIILAIIFLLHAAGLGLRWYVAGHAPWSNGYEALTFIAWASVLAGIVFSRKSAVTLSSTAILAALILQTAHLSWMDPQITNLVPVLKSYWLVIHVAMITSSYGFLGLGALVAGFNMLLMFFQSGKNRYHLDAHLGKLTHIVEMTLIAGLYLLSIGTFLGGVWANESWGRYWAWDPKETWALITILVYAVILHLRLVPGLKGRLLFNAVSLWAFWSVIMTYFGVNYYLSGLHSYAAGDPLPVPPVIYYTLAIMAVITVLTIVNQYRLDKVSKNIS